MKVLLFSLIALQLSLSFVIAQITFTREWVAGKRAFPSSNVASVHDEDHGVSSVSNCQSLWPAIDHLLELEKLRRQGPCGAQLTKAGNYLDITDKRYPRLNFLLKAKEEQSEEDGNSKNS